jgi:hypothetical protein
MAEYKPEFPYLGEQIIINSGRVILNSKDDSVFLFSKKAIGFSSAGTINFDADDSIIVNTPKLYLGIGAEEPLVKGTQLTIMLDDILDALRVLSVQLSGTMDSNGVYLTNIIQASDSLNKSVSRIKNRVSDITSKQNYTL